MNTRSESTSEDALVEIIRLMLKLSPEDRLEIGQCMLASGAQEEIDRAWNEEIAWRLKELEEGRGETYPASQVMAELRKMLEDISSASK